MVDVVGYVDAGNNLNQNAAVKYLFGTKIER